MNKLTWKWINEYENEWMNMKMNKWTWKWINEWLNGWKILRLHLHEMYIKKRKRISKWVLKNIC